MKILAIGKLTPDSLAFMMAATDAMNLVTPTSGHSTRTHSQSTGEPSTATGGSPELPEGA